MSKKTTLLAIATAVVVGMLLLICSFIGGALYTRGQDNQPAQQITSQIIVDKITNEAFVVTKTIFLDQKAQIKIDQGSDWSNFWWGQTINTEGLIRIDLGVDYKKIQASDITVDNAQKKISIKLPQSEILDASLSGDIKVESQSGVLKYLLANDPNQDHNLALQELIKEASTTVNADDSLKQEARTDSTNFLQLVLKDSGYTVEVIK